MEKIWSDREIMKKLHDIKINEIVEIQDGLNNPFELLLGRIVGDSQRKTSC